MSRPALPLRSGSRAVQDARVWVRSVCDEISREDLVDCAELGVSELVSNALFHGIGPVTIRLRGTVDHPRVEIHDASTDPPLLPVPLSLDDEEVLLTVGRGLSIVASVSEAWGADIDAAGKTVWFAPATELTEGAGAEGVITGPTRAAAKPDHHHYDDAVEISILGVPHDLYTGFQLHFRELRREVRLLSLAHANDYPLAASLSDLFTVLERQLLDGLGISHGHLPGTTEGQETADLHVRMPRSAAETVSRFLEMLDLIDEFCRQERLLVLARSPEQVAFQRWFLGEYVIQASGGRSTRWSPARVGGPRGHRIDDRHRA